MVRMIRRRVFGQVIVGAGLAWLGAPLSAWGEAGHPPGKSSLSPTEALARLRAGNRGFAADAPAHVDLARTRRLEVAASQSPFAAIVSCSDSRVPPELLFGQGLGDLFILRNAGNTVTGDALQGSIDYAVAELGVPLIVVLGHERCGAVAAAVSLVRENARFPGRIAQIAEAIRPAVKAAQDHPGELFDNAMRENVRQVARRLRDLDAAPVLAGPLRDGKLRVVGACYDLDTGLVDFLDA